MKVSEVQTILKGHDTRGVILKGHAATTCNSAKIKHCPLLRGRCILQISLFRLYLPWSSCNELHFVRYVARTNILQNLLCKTTKCSLVNVKREGRNSRNTFCLQLINIRIFSFSYQQLWSSLYMIRWLIFFVGKFLDCNPKNCQDLFKKKLARFVFNLSIFDIFLILSPKPDS